MCVNVFFFWRRLLENIYLKDREGDGSILDFSGVQVAYVPPASTLNKIGNVRVT
jgi:hypothetical protein